MPGLITRGILYLLAAIFLGELVCRELDLVGPSRAFTEYGNVQIAQSVFLFAGSLLLFLKSWRDEGCRQLALSMGLFFAVLFIRENDQPLELFLPDGAWKYVAAPFGIALFAYLWKQREAVRRQLTHWSRSFGFGVMVSGFVVLVFSRLIGRKELWMQLMSEHFHRSVKNAAEESVELVALALILIAIVEFFFSRQVRPGSE